MEPFDSIEEVIDEHGSSKILRERLGLAADQYAALERKVSELTNETVGLSSENEKLRRVIAEREKEVRSLQAALQEYRSAASELDDVRKRILVLLASHRRMTALAIANALQIHHVVAEHAVHQLYEAEFMFGNHYMGRATEYSLAPKGDEYLVTQNLLNSQIQP